MLQSIIAQQLNRSVEVVFHARVVLYHVHWEGDVLYTGDSHVYDVRDPSAPVLLGEHETGASGPFGGSSSEIWAGGGHIVTKRGIVAPQCALAPADAEDTPGARGGYRLCAVPNPFNPRTVVSFVLPRAGEASLRLFDLRGRAVRTLHASHLPEGPHAVPWDGRDDTGDGVASGVYHARLETRDRRETAQLVLVR